MEMNKTQLYDLMATTSEELVSQYIENQPEIVNYFGPRLRLDPKRFNCQHQIAKLSNVF